MLMEAVELIRQPSTLSIASVEGAVPWDGNIRPRYGRPRFARLGHCECAFPPSGPADERFRRHEFAARCGDWRACDERVAAGVGASVPFGTDAWDLA